MVNTTILVSGEVDRGKSLEQTSVIKHNSLGNTSILASDEADRGKSLEQTSVIKHKPLVNTTILVSGEADRGKSLEQTSYNKTSFHSSKGNQFKWCEDNRWYKMIT